MPANTGKRLYLDVWLEGVENAHVSSDNVYAGTVYDSFYKSGIRHGIDHIPLNSPPRRARSDSETDMYIGRKRSIRNFGVFKTKSELMSNVVAMRKKGMCYEDIADEVGVDESIIKSYYLTLGYGL